MTSSPPVQTPVNPPLLASASSQLPDLSIGDHSSASHLDASGLPTSSKPRGSTPISKRIANLLLWEDVLASCLALVSGVLLVFLVQVCGYSLLTLACYVLMLQLLICLIYVNGTKFFLHHATPTQPPPSSSSASSSAFSSAPSSSSALPSQLPPLSFDSDVADYPYFDQDLVLTYSGHIADTLNTLTQSLSHLLHCTNTLHSLQALAALTALSVLGRLLDGLTLLGCVWVGVFVAPKGYLMYREQVDEVVGRWRARVDEVLAEVRRFVPSGRGGGGGDGKDKVE